jgi:lipoprotein-releasing system ATP-binding protein
MNKSFDASSTPVFSLQTIGLSKQFDAKRATNTHATDNDSLPILNAIDLSIHAGDALAIVGASGSGKSTLLHLLGGLDDPTSGDIRVNGMSMLRLNDQQKSQLRNQQFGFVYQFHHLLPEFTALENVMMPVLIARQSKAQAKELALALLDQVGLSHRVHHKPSALSGGERQRAAIARALVMSPACLFADEPTGNLDEATAQHIFDLMLSLNQQLGTALVIVTHAQTIADRLPKQYRLSAGHLACITP